MKEETANMENTEIEHLLPFNFTVQYLPGNKMHIADILSRLAGKDLEPSEQLIPVSFNVHTRSTRPLKLYTADKHKISMHIPYTTKTITPKSIHSKTKVTHTTPSHPPKVEPYTSVMSWPNFRLLTKLSFYLVKL